MDNTPENANSTQAQPRALAAELENLSAWMDGQGFDGDWTALSASYSQNSQTRQAWAQYHWVGDVLREGRAALPAADPDFVRGVMARVTQVQVTAKEPEQVTSVRPAANDAVFHWPRLAGWAAALVVAVGAWQFWGGVAGQPEPWGNASTVAQVDAKGPTVAWRDDDSRLQPVVTERGVFIRDPQLQALLAEHRDNGGMTALQVPTGFMRNAAYAQADR